MGIDPVSVRGRRGRWLLLATAAAQWASPFFAGFEQGSWSDPVLVPPGPFFAIWGPITLGCLAAAVWGLPLRRAVTAPYLGIQLPMSLVQTGFVAWLVAAALAPLLTLPTFVAMLVGLAVSLRRLVRSRTGMVTRLLLGGSIGLYAGWSAAAVWLNAATVLPGLEAAGPAGSAAVLLGAILTGLVGAWFFRGQVGLVLGVGWALLGVTVATAGAGAATLAAMAGLGLLGLVVTAFWARRVSESRPSATS